jgi:hypothetical protein
LCVQSSLISVVTFTSVLIIVLYALIAISAIVSRFTQRELERPFRMPLWPVAPVIALVGVGIALSQQKGSDLIIVAAIFGGGIIYYVGFLMPRKRPLLVASGRARARALRGCRGGIVMKATPRTTEYSVSSPSEAMPVIVAQLPLALQVGQQGIYS